MSETEILRVDKFDGERQVVWDASSLGSLQDCPTKYYLGTVLGYRSKHQSAAKDWGTAVHYGLEQYERLRIAGTDSDGALCRAITDVIERYSELKKSNDSARTLDTALRAIVWAAETPELWGDTTATWDVGEQSVPAIEARFEVPVPGLGDEYRFSGKLDKVIWVGDELFILDRKTTKKGLTDWFYNTYHPSTQFKAYVWALRDVMGLPVGGVIVEAIQAAVGFNRFDRRRFYYHTDVTAEFGSELAGWIEDANRQREAGIWRHGCSVMCEYPDICSRSPRVRDAMLESNYKKRERPVHVEATTESLNVDPTVAGDSNSHTT